mgnify:CR=1 FL=1
MRIDDVLEYGAAVSQFVAVTGSRSRTPSSIANIAYPLGYAPCMPSEVQN